MVKANPMTVAVAASRFRSGAKTRKRGREKIGRGVGAPGTQPVTRAMRLGGRREQALGARQEEDEGEEDAYQGIQQRDEVIIIMEEKAPSQSDIWAAAFNNGVEQKDSVVGDNQEEVDNADEPPKEKSQHLKDLESAAENINIVLKNLQSLTPM